MVLCEFSPFIRLEPRESRQRSAGFRDARRSPKELRAVSREVAADLGLTMVQEDSDRLHLRDPFLLRVFPVELVVKVQGEYGQVDVQVVGYSGAGGFSAQPRYVDRLVRTFSERVRLGGQGAAGAIEPSDKKRRRRKLMSYLRVVQWIPLALLVPVLVVMQTYWQGANPSALAVAWAYLAVAVPAVASYWRRRVAGLGSAGDAVPFAVVTALFVVGIVCWVMLGGRH